MIKSKTKKVLESLNRDSSNETATATRKKEEGKKKKNPESTTERIKV